jgi:methanogenic corrinoid protein MtbC1
VRTPGGHRRYTPVSLHRFASIRGLQTDLLPPLPPIAPKLPLPADITLYQALAQGDPGAVRALITPPADSLAKRAAFLDRVVGDALREIGYRWERGDLGVDQEHRASNMVVDSVDRLRPRIDPSGKLVLLACPPDEWHELPLRLVRLVFEWSGWRTEFLGAGLPWTAARSAVERARPAVIGFSSRNGDAFQEPEFDRFVEFCRNSGTKIIVGGEWARGGSGSGDSYLRFRTLRGFERWLRTQ